MASEYLNVEEAAEYLNQKVRFIRRLVAERRVVYYKHGAHVRFKIEDLEGFAQAGRIEPAARFKRAA